jgi:hypothetical protein
VTSDVALPGSIELADWPELSYRLGLTDGLPTFPPTRDAVDRLVAGSGRAADEVIGTIPPRGAEATVEAVSANAAMAGCLPEHVPIVLAALDAMLEERFNLAGVQATTHPCWPLVIVSGPIVRELDMATRESVWNGGGARANLAIGRAVRLVLWNIGGARPRRPVQEVMGHPGRMAFCVAEEPDNTPWPPLHEARGVQCARGGVTVIACEAPQSVAFWGMGDDPRHRLGMVADQMRALGNNNTNTMGECLVAFSPSEARYLSHQGYTRERVQHELWELARRRLGDLRHGTPEQPPTDPRSWYAWWPEWVDQSNEDTMVPAFERPESINVIVTGADSIPWAVVCPGWGSLGGFAVSRALPESQPPPMRP